MVVGASYSHADMLKFDSLYVDLDISCRRKLNMEDHLDPHRDLKLHQRHPPELLLHDPQNE